MLATLCVRLLIWRDKGCIKTCIFKTMKKLFKKIQIILDYKLLSHLKYKKFSGGLKPE